MFLILANKLPCYQTKGDLEVNDRSCEKSPGVEVLNYGYRGIPLFSCLLQFTEHIRNVLLDTYVLVCFYLYSDIHMSIL